MIHEPLSWRLCNLFDKRHMLVEIKRTLDDRCSSSGLANRCDASTDWCGWHLGTTGYRGILLNLWYIVGISWNIVLNKHISRMVIKCYRTMDNSLNTSIIINYWNTLFNRIENFYQKVPIIIDNLWHFLGPK